jgi:ribosome-associated protein
MPDKDVEITFMRSNGPGGQHRNKTETGVRLVHTPTGITVTATERRSRRQNLDVAFARMKKRLEEHFKPVKKRVPTKPTKGSRKRHEAGKKHQSKIKDDRKPPRMGE